jgi:glycerate-2-kinase
MPLASDALAIATAGVAAVDPRTAVRSAFARRAGTSWLGTRLGSVHVVALGKAAGAMATTAAESLGGLFAGGIAVVRDPDPSLPESIHAFQGDHPVPTGASFRAGAALLGYVRELAPEDRVLFLISGGGSSLAEAPSTGVGLSAIRRTTEVLLASGAPIQAMNAIRRHLSALKGGHLAVASRARRSLTLAISDVVGDGPSEVASGPTAPDPSTFADALAAIERFRLADRIPAEVLEHLEQGREGRVPETVKPGDPRIARSRYRFIATNRIALAGAATEARRRGYRVLTVSGHMVGETAPVATRFAQRVVRAGDRGPATAILGGGETTVTLPSHPGKGGRNQEFALAASIVLAGHPGTLLLSMGTDGIDGPTDAAGGWADDGTLARSAGVGVDVRTALADHDAYPALARLGALLRTGPTGTNVMDLHVGLAKRPAPRRPRAALGS